VGNATFTFRTIIHATQENALLGFRHNGTYGKFALVGFDVLPASPISSNVLLGTRSLSRISALVGGVDVPYLKAKSGVASLPSQVQIVRRPEQVTLASPSLYRSVLPIPISMASLSLKAWGRDSTDNVSNGSWWRSGYGDSNIQKVLLREGQGFALTSASADPVYPQTLALTIVLRNASSGATYIINSQHHPSEMSGAAFAILNGSGSGITLEVVSVQVSDIGDAAGWATTPSVLRLLRIYRLIGGKDIAPIPSRSDRAVPSFLIVRRNFLADDLGVMYMGDVTGGPNAVEYGFPSTNAPLFFRTGCFGRRVLAQLGVANPGLALPFWNPAIWWNKTVSGINFSGGHDMHIVCNPGEGFAVMQSYNTMYAEYYIEMTIEWIPDTAENKAPVVGNYLVKGGE
jgi:hypothetical protein